MKECQLFVNRRWPPIIIIVIRINVFFSLPPFLLLSLLKMKKKREINLKKQTVVRTEKKSLKRQVSLSWSGFIDTLEGFYWWARVNTWA